MPPLKSTKMSGRRPPLNIISEPMKKETSGISPLAAIAVLAVMASMTYLVVRTVLLYRARYTLIDGGMAILLIFAECFILLHSVGYTMNILKVYSNSRRGKAKPPTAEIDPEDLPWVAILVPARHEPREVLQKTFLTINNLDYPAKRVYFLDDSLEESYKKEAEEIAQANGVTLFRRTKAWHGAKAGIVNDCLDQLTEKYVVVFDADQNPMPDFLKELVPIMEADEKLAFVQTPQFYTNIETSRIARAAVLQQAVFYEYICEGKGVSDAMFCCGTNVIFRTEALRRVGGMDESTVTEDFATSLKLHTQGYRSLYYNHVCAFGMGPEDLSGYFRQQFRWASGTIRVFREVVRRFVRNPFSMKGSQWAEYFLSSTYYLVGMAFSVLVASPLIFIFFKVPSFFADPTVYLLSFFPHLLLSMSVFYFALWKRQYQPRDLVLGQLLGTATFLVYVRAALAGFLGLKLSFGVTPKTSSGRVPLRVLWPQITAMLLNYVAVVWAGNRFFYEHDPAVLVNGFWSFYHFLVFSSVFYFNQPKS